MARTGGLRVLGTEKLKSGRRRWRRKVNQENEQFFAPPTRVRETTGVARTPRQKFSLGSTFSGSLGLGGLGASSHFDAPRTSPSYYREPLNELRHERQALRITRVPATVLRYLRRAFNTANRTALVCYNFHSVRMTRAHLRRKGPNGQSLGLNTIMVSIVSVLPNCHPSKGGEQAQCSRHTTRTRGETMKRRAARIEKIALQSFPRAHEGGLPRLRTLVEKQWHHTHKYEENRGEYRSRR